MDKNTIKKIFTLFLCWKLVIVVSTLLTVFTLPLQVRFTPLGWDLSVRDLPYIVWVWGNFDGVHYLEIARNGYHVNEHAFFPLFPILIKIVYSLLDLFSFVPYVITAQLVSNMFFLASLFIIVKTLAVDRKIHLQNLLLFILLVFPTSFFYQAIYNDSLFFFLSTLTIYLARKKRWVLSSFSGGLATLARQNGLALLFIVAVEYLFSSEEKITMQWSFKQIVRKCRSRLSIPIMMKEKFYALCFIPIAFLGYLVYTHIFYQNWRLVFSSLSVWGQDQIIFPLQVVIRYLKIFFLSPTLQVNYWVALLEFSSVIFYITIFLLSFKKIRLSYWILMVVSILIPSFTGTFQGMPRYGLHLYPLFLSLTLFLGKRSKRFQSVYFTASILLFFLILMLFARGYFVA